MCDFHNDELSNDVQILTLHSTAGESQGNDKRKAKKGQEKGKSRRHG